jgi:hypothetical protein
MAMNEYTFCKGLEYPAIVAVSQRIAWTVDEIFANRRFAVTKPIVPIPGGHRRARVPR